MSRICYLPQFKVKSNGVYVVSGLVPVVTMTQGLHDISVLLTDLYGNEQTFTFEYEQPIYLGFDFIDGEPFMFIGLFYIIT